MNGRPYMYVIRGDSKNKLSTLCIDCGTNGRWEPDNFPNGRIKDNLPRVLSVNQNRTSRILTTVYDKTKIQTLDSLATVNQTMVNKATVKLNGPPPLQL